MYKIEKDMRNTAITVVNTDTGSNYKLPRGRMYIIIPIIQKYIPDFLSEKISEKWDINIPEACAKELVDIMFTMKKPEKHKTDTITTTTSKNKEPKVSNPEEKPIDFWAIMRKINK